MDGKADLLNALHRLRAHLDATAKALSPNLNYCLNPGLKAGATLDLSLQELELACETLRRCNLESLRLLYARNGLKRWPEQPTLVLHAFEATHLDSYVPPNPARSSTWNRPWNAPRRKATCAPCIGSGLS